MAHAVVNIRLLAIAVAVIAIPASAHAGEAHGMESLVTDAGALIEAVAQSARRVPVLFVSLAVLAAIPPLMLLGSLARFTLAGGGKPEPPMPAGETPRMPVGEAYLVAERSGQPFRIAIGNQALRIGREADNDLRIPHGTVHGYHALIEREGAEGITITDLSAPDGNGVYVNGLRIRHARLAPGDTVALGAAVLRFTAEPLAGRPPLQH